MTNLEVVEKLNDHIYETLGDKGTPHYFMLIDSGYYQAILFDDVVMWNSDNDERFFIDDINDYEPMINFLITQFQKYVNDLINISVFPKSLIQ